MRKTMKNQQKRKRTIVVDFLAVKVIILSNLLAAFLAVQLSNLSKKQNKEKAGKESRQL